MAEPYGRARSAVEDVFARRHELTRLGVDARDARMTPKQKQVTRRMDAASDAVGGMRYHRAALGMQDEIGAGLRHANRTRMDMRQQERMNAADNAADRSGYTTRDNRTVQGTEKQKKAWAARRTR